MPLKVYTEVGYEHISIELTMIETIYKMMGLCSLIGINQIQLNSDENNGHNSVRGSEGKVG